ncbi:porin family protein [Vibrio sp. JC009]|uniref:hypothetical protein n=1 Tax=Vibrio sp. JC009 TaxID=2912314 RepID=UPI0023AE76A4|nr:hypothetical protein [Vibrio sp. JC009]WED22356.1 porin family protein [Vibrio sp. JC009]
MGRTLYILLFLLISNNTIASQNEIGLKNQWYLGSAYRMYENEKPVHVFYNHHFSDLWSVGVNFGNRPTQNVSFEDHDTSIKQKGLQIYGTGYLPLSQRFIPYLSLGLGVAYGEVKHVYHDGPVKTETGFTPPALIAEIGSVLNITNNINARVSLGAHHLPYEEFGKGYGSVGVNAAIGIGYRF